jgi:flagellar motility protein MotE (MotC chaperone)
MILRIPAPRLLPMTIATLAALLTVKSGGMLEAALTRGHTTEGGMVAIAKAAGTETVGDRDKPATTAPAEAKKPPPGGQPGAAATDCPPPVSDSEKALLQDLRQRRQDLDERATALGARESLLAAADQKISSRVAELQALQKQLEAMDAARRQKEDAGWQGLVKMYEAMKPKDAAAIFNDLSLSVLLPVLDRMKDSKAAAVLSAMTPDKARDVTAELVQMRMGHDPPAAFGAVPSGPSLGGPAAAAKPSGS